jgi:hypothetical protein
MERDFTAPASADHRSPIIGSGKPESAAVDLSLATGEKRSA